MPEPDEYTAPAPALAPGLGSAPEPGPEPGPEPAPSGVASGPALAGPGPLVARLDALTALIEGQLADALSQRAAFDRLYADFDACRKGELDVLVLPWINGLIRLHDHLSRALDALTARGDDPAALAVTQLAGVREELKVLFENNGVTLFQDAEPRYQSRRQSVVVLVPTDDPAQDGLIATRRRPGFERGVQLLRKERVDVFRCEPNAPADPG